MIGELNFAYQAHGSPAEKHLTGPGACMTVKGLHTRGGDEVRMGWSDMS